jgi:hypothetical protein
MTAEIVFSGGAEITSPAKGRVGNHPALFLKAAGPEAGKSRRAL